MDDLVSCEFEAAYVLVCELAVRLRTGYHYRDTQGRALLTLDEVVRAILDGRWPVDPEPAPASAAVRPAFQPAPRRVQPWPPWVETSPA